MGGGGGEREDPCTHYIAGNTEVFYMAIGVQSVRQGRRSRGALNPTFSESSMLHYIT